MLQIRPKNPARWLALAALAVLLPSCEVSPTDLDRNTAFREAREQWTLANVSSYSYTVRRNCFCAAATQGPARVEVRNGQTVSVTAAAGATAFDRAAFDAYDTVDELFQQVERAMDAKPFRLAVSYDTELGFPSEMFMNPGGNTADDESGFVVVDFQRAQ